MDKLKVFKIGGTLIDQEASLKTFLKQLAKVKGAKVLVHGGGNIAGEIGDRLGIKAKMIDGRRVTDKQTLEVVTMVYAGLLNKKIVAILSSYDALALGMCGADLNMIRVQRRPSKPVDYGYVGDIVELNKTGIVRFLDMGILPVFSAITHDNKGQLYNTNADSIASDVAASLSLGAEVDLIYCFDRAGVLRDPEDHSSVIPSITAEQFQAYKADGTISAGMIPKLEGAFDSITSGVSSVTLCHYSAINKLGNKDFVGTIMKSE